MVVTLRARVWVEISSTSAEPAEEDVTLRARVWVEMPDPPTRRLLPSSPSVRGCGLKSQSTPIWAQGRQSPSVRGCGLKSLSPLSSTAWVLSPSVRGCGLKFPGDGHTLCRRRSPSVRGCGLKSWPPSGRPGQPEVTLRARVWVEIVLSCFAFPPEPRHPPCEGVG